MATNEEAPSSQIKKLKPTLIDCNPKDKTVVLRYTSINKIIAGNNSVIADNISVTGLLECRLGNFYLKDGGQEISINVDTNIASVSELNKLVGETIV
jgi:hypothetical protein